MDAPLDIKSLLRDSRAQVYLVWAAIVAVGFTTTHYYQDKNINFVWFILSALGFYFMYRVMPLRVSQMKKIFLAWLIPISFGLAMSIVTARGWAFVELVGYLGSFWLVVSAVGFIANGLVDKPMGWYLMGAGMCLVGAVLCYYNTTFLIGQYLVAAVVSTWAMLNLVIFRADQQ